MLLDTECGGTQESMKWEWEKWDKEWLHNYLIKQRWKVDIIVEGHVEEARRFGKWCNIWDNLPYTECRGSQEDSGKYVNGTKT